MTLPTGEWQMVANGHTRSLKIESVSGNGHLKAVMQNSAEVHGFWDERAKRITFQRIIKEDEPKQEQTYVGYLMDDPDDEEADYYRLAGHFDYFGPAATAERTVYGWLARIKKTTL
jgi:hypothetical protein